jgi:hypothetical protein
MLLVSHVAGSLRTKSVITGHTVAVFAGPIWSSPAYRSLTLRIAYTKPYGCPNLKHCTGADRVSTRLCNATGDGRAQVAVAQLARAPTNVVLLAVRCRHS